MLKRIETFGKSMPIFKQFEKAGNLRSVKAKGSKKAVFKRVEKLFLKEGLVEKAKAKPSKPSRPLPKVIFVMGGPGAGKGTQCK